MKIGSIVKLQEQSTFFRYIMANEKELFQEYFNGVTAFKLN